LKIEDSTPSSGHPQPSSEVHPARGLRGSLISYCLVLVVGIAVAITLQGFVVKPFLVPSSSMAGTIVPGQRILVDRMVYRFRAVRRGDVIVFRGPAPPHELLVKRVVGVPGDLLFVRAGQLYVNGVKTSDAHVDRVDGTAEPTEPADPYTSSQPFAPWSLARPFRVPPGRYFVMGDNRTDSEDSRYWGTVPRSAIIGEAFLAYWPLGRLGGL